MQIKTRPTKDKIKEKWDKRPIIISDQSSVEIEQQILNTAISKAATGKVDFLRAGIWKPRTKPGMFEGLGIQGLEWLSQAKALTGLPTTVEVASAKHVEDALHFNVDI